jgi:predicted metal-dependent peptidase
MWPSRLDLVFRLTGLSDTFGIYHNLYPARSGARLAVGFYVDVSGSMIPKLPTVLACAKAMREIPLRLRIFDTEVRSAEWEQLARGKVEGGGGTNFTPVVQDLLDHPELLGGIIVTDGQGGLDQGVARSLSRTHQELHVLYVLGTDESVPEGSINSLAKHKLVVRATR